MTVWPEHIRGATTHARRGAIRNAFRYGVDYLLIDPTSTAGPRLFSRNRFNLAAVHDCDHGGAPKAGRGLAWARDVFERAGLEGADIQLLTQARMFGYLFNPVSFWLAFRGEALVAVIAEVNNTVGDRHSYLCRRVGFAPIGKGDVIEAEKIFHVSPFQDIAGRYRFTFEVSDARIAIRIAHENGEEGVIATLFGARRPMSNMSLVHGALRRPLGSGRVMLLILWQALKLKAKGATFRPRPLPPREEVS